MGTKKSKYSEQCMKCIAKATHIKSQFRLNQNNPKKFWHIIHNIIAPKVDVFSCHRFYDDKTNSLVNKGVSMYIM